MVAKNGALTEYITAGVRVLESGCGPCIGLGQAPPSDGVSVRTFNRNFPGRSGTPNDKVYLSSVETAVATALTGEITDPTTLGEPPQAEFPEQFLIDDRMIIPPAEDPESAEILRGPNIQPVPIAEPLAESLRGRVLLKVGDNITTDHIMPAGQWLKYRSNVPAYSDAVFYGVDPTFPDRARAAGVGLVIGGDNYGQGSSREHAAMVPMYLGLRAVLAKSFARIHRANLINFGIVPVVVPAEAYDAIDQGDEIELPELRDAVKNLAPIKVRNVTQDTELRGDAGLTPRQAEILLAGGLLNYTKQQAE